MNNFFYKNLLKYNTKCIFVYYMDKLTSKEQEALRAIRNSIMHHGRFPGVRELMRLMDYKSSRSAAILLEQLEQKKFVEKKSGGGYLLMKDISVEKDRAQTVDVPLVGSAACGMPILAEQNVEAMIPVSIELARPPHKYFLLHASGDSMNEAGIEDGDLVLVKQQDIAESRDIVVALIDDQATIKEIQIKSDSVLLMPRCKDERKYQPIILTSDFRIQGKVIKSISKG